MLTGFRTKRYMPAPTAAAAVSSLCALVTITATSGLTHLAVSKTSRLVAPGRLTSRRSTSMSISPHRYCECVVVYLRQSGDLQHTRSQAHDALKQLQVDSRVLLNIQRVLLIFNMLGRATQESKRELVATTVSKLARLDQEAPRGARPSQRARR